MAAAELPLAHLRVLEIATDIAGPYAGKLFADAGADGDDLEADHVGLPRLLRAEEVRQAQPAAAALAGEGEPGAFVALFVQDVTDNDLGALLDKQPRIFGSHTARAATYQRDLAVYPTHVGLLSI